MRDSVSISRVQLLHPLVRTEVSLLIDRVELEFPSYIAVRIVQGLRTIDEQDALFNQPHDGKDNDGDGKIDEADEHVTNARGGSSYHNYGLAIDFALLYDKDKNGKYETLSWDLVADMDRDGKRDWSEMVNVFKSAGWEWGGNWQTLIDNPHLQKTFGYTWKQLLTKYKNREFIPGTQYVKL